MPIHHDPQHSVLGKKTQYDLFYDPDLLYCIDRSLNRNAIGLSGKQLPFYGADIWNHYEISWLNNKGKPVVAIGEIHYSCESTFIIESKSMKLYFNSLNQMKFENHHEVMERVHSDLSQRLGGGELFVKIIPLSQIKNDVLHARLEGENIDELDINCDTYRNNPDFLIAGSEIVEETLTSDLLKSNCLVTNQPDWCSVQIVYRGRKIDREGLLRYITSFRNDNEFHEQSMEKIYLHIMKICQPEKLLISGRSTRRGGLDINSYRASYPIEFNTFPNLRLCRQ